MTYIKIVLAVIVGNAISLALIVVCDHIKNTYERRRRRWGLRK